MPDSYDWQMARRVARLAAHAPGRGMPRWELAAQLGETWNFDTWVKLAYCRRWVDCVRDYVVAPTLGPGPGQLCWGAEPPLCSGLCGPRGRPCFSPPGTAGHPAGNRSLPDPMPPDCRSGFPAHCLEGGRA